MTLTPTPPIALAIPEVVNKLVDLAECVCAYLAVEGAGETCWCGLYPGSAVSWEYCTECSNGMCGMGYVRPASASSYEVFPQPAIDIRCTLPMAWGVEVGALRCLHTPEDGTLLDVGSMAEATIRQILDARALRNAIKCCGLNIGLGSWIPLGPQGGCVGGYWQAFLDVD